MTLAWPQLLFSIIFLTILFLHIAKKNLGAVIAYGIQSFAVALLLLGSFFATGDRGLLVVVILTIIVKVVVSPIFFISLIRKNALTFSASTSLSLPMTLVCMAALIAVAHAPKFFPLTTLFPANHSLLSFALSAIFLSLFLFINRKGLLSQIIGVLSLENSILAFTALSGLEQSPMLQIGVIFNIFIWLMIATSFAAMIYRHSGSFDSTAIKHLTD